VSTPQAPTLKGVVLVDNLNGTYTASSDGSTSVDSATDALYSSLVGQAGWVELSLLLRYLSEGRPDKWGVLKQRVSVTTEPFALASLNAARAYTQAR
jgi:hypothetical protein